MLPELIGKGFLKKCHIYNAVDEMDYDMLWFSSERGWEC